MRTSTIWATMRIVSLSIISTRRSFAFVNSRNFHRASLARRFLSATTMDGGQDEAQLMQDMLARIRRINRVPADTQTRIMDFMVDGVVLGKVFPKVADMLCETKVGTASSSIFEMKEDTLTLSASAGSTSESRTEAIGLVMAALRDKGIVTGWRDELYPVADNFYSEPTFLMERAATNLLGVLEYGVHINGLVQESPMDEPKMWIARRSATKSKYPGMLDHLVAGGQPAGLGLLDNVVKECEEEAGIPEDLARAGVQAVGAISYEDVDPKKEKISRVVLFNYDLYLPKDFQPKPVDGEVEEFFLWTIAQIKESMTLDYHDPIKPNCYVVIIDYLLRMGFVSPETSGYLDVLRELRSGDCR